MSYVDCSRLFHICTRLKGTIGILQQTESLALICEPAIHFVEITKFWKMIGSGEKSRYHFRYTCPTSHGWKLLQKTHVYIQNWLLENVQVTGCREATIVCWANITTHSNGLSKKLIEKAQVIPSNKKWIHAHRETFLRWWLTRLTSRLNDFRAIIDRRKSVQLLSLQKLPLIDDGATQPKL